MPLEIEIKLKVASHAAILKRLRAVKAKHVGKVRETNVFFDFPKGSLRKGDRGLRVRVTGKTEESSALLTFKGPARKKGLRSREAFDVTCVPREQVVPLLEALGLRQTFSFEKDRDSWKLKGCSVELDRLPHFGTFVEIEGPSEKAVRAVQKRLELEGNLQERVSYSQRVSEYLKGRKRRQLGF